MEKYKLHLQPKAKASSVVQGDCYRFTVLTDRLIRMEYSVEGRFVDEPTKTVLCRDFPAADFRVIEKADSLEIVTEHLHVYYDKKPFSKLGLRIEMSRGYHVFGSTWNYGDVADNLMGTARTLDNANGAIPLEPGLLSRSGFTVLDDSDSAFIGEDMWPVAKDFASTDLYFFGYGHDYLGCLKDFYRLSGPTPLLPRFALGNWWSRFYRYSEDSYLQLMDRFEKEGIPFSTAVIDMDWHLTQIPEKYGSGWTGYTWNRELFPDPGRFMDKLHEKGMKITLNVHPADGVRGHEEAYLPMAKELGVDWENEDKIPFEAGNRKFMDAYFKYLHHPNEELGVDFWWLDWQQGTRGEAPGIDTLWMLNHLHFLDSGREGKQPLTFSRYAGIGSHRYPVGFSGDTHTTWESLDFQPYFTANASNAGYSWWSHDIGGHMAGYRDDELTVRWVQLGAFSPILRLHSTNNEFYGKEPWNYGAVAQNVLTKFLRLRHKLIPYLYTMNYLTHSEGLPLVQPMYYRHEDGAAYTVPNQFYFGTEMMVCPITKPADKHTLLAEFDAWLPEGDYIDFFTGTHYKGGRKMKLFRNLETLPVLVRAGGIIPMAEDLDSHLKNPEKLEVQIFAGADGSFTMYEDQDGGAATTTFTFTNGEESLLTVRTAGDTGVIPENRSYCLKFRGVEKPLSVSVDNWAYDGDARALTVWITGEKDFRLAFRRDCAAIAAPEKTAAIYGLLHGAQIAYDLKTDIFSAVSADADTVRILGDLYQMNLDSNLMGAVVEQLICDK